jgi:Histidine phosphatase superfamily (branch 1)
VTAEQIRNGQCEPNRSALTVIPVQELQEQDFGLFEGVSYHEYSQRNPRHAGVETVESMSRRSNAFIKESILPLFDNRSSPVVAIVSHGRMLQTLWPQILSMINPTSVVCDQQLLVDSRSIDHSQIGAWSNTGFIEVTFSRPLVAQPSYPAILSLPVTTVEAEAEYSRLQTDDVNSGAVIPKPVSYTAFITAINGRDHLVGLTRAKGGLGSARYDSRQGTLDRFFVQPRPG